MDAPTADAGNAWPSGLMLIQGNRLEALRDLLVAWLRRYPLAPLEDEVILVQSNGIAQWLKLALATNPEPDGGGGLGIAAAIRVELPGRFLWRAYRSLLGALPPISPLDKGPLTWRLYRLLDDPGALGEAAASTDAMAPLRAFLDAGRDQRRRHQLAARLADLYDQYQVYRADWLELWAQGKDQLIRPNGTTDAVPPAQAWQPALWRALVQDVATLTTAADRDLDAAALTSRAAIHREFLRRAKDPAAHQAAAEPLPRRLMVFGISALPQQTLEVLQAIADHAQVLLFVHNPCKHYWGDIIEGRELFRQSYRRTAARKVPDGLDLEQLHPHGHPLLAAWGKQGRDYIRLLDGMDERARYESHFTRASLAIDLFESPGEATLLQQLQDDVLELRPLAERRALDSRIDPARDQSLQFLIAHSPQREIEILQDQLLDAFAQAHRLGNPLQPRDILVMVPDIDRYAPHIQAVFGRLEPDDPRYLPFHLSDQGERHRSPLLIGLESLLQLPQSRFAVSELLDLLDIPALRARFGIADGDLPRLRRWIQGANIRWGLDAGQRAQLGLPEDLERNSWRFGLQRMLLGYAVGASGPWQDIEPYPEIGGLEAALLGPLMRLLETLEQAWQALQQARSPDDWVGLLGGLLTACFQPLDERDQKALDQVQEALERWLTETRLAALNAAPLPLAVVREALLGALDATNLNQRFLAGAVNFATLMPMRAVPFRQIWLLGMNDGDYPRAVRAADFDLMAEDYRPGDRSRREDDRYLFLEALLSARERLVISWVGRSIRDDSVRPPSVLVAQLRDHLAAGWRLAEPTPTDGHDSGVDQGLARHGDPGPDAGPDATPDPEVDPGEALLAALTSTHPLQPFSTAYFEPHRPPRLFTYAHEWRALHDPGMPPAAEVPPDLGPPPLEGPVNLHTLGDFLRDPVRAFYRRRLGVWLEPGEDQVADDEAFWPDALASWTLRNGLLEPLIETLDQHPKLDPRQPDPRQILQGRIARQIGAGALPQPPLDQLLSDDLLKALQQPSAGYAALLNAYPERCQPETVRLEAHGIALEDSLTRIRVDADGQRLLVLLQASRLQRGEQIQWHNLVRHWPVHLAAQLGGETSTRILGPETDLLLAPLPPDQAKTLLLALLHGYLTGVSRLLPLACKTSFAWLTQQAGKKADPRYIYDGDEWNSGERDSHAGYGRFWPDFATLSAVPGFAAMTQRLYAPLYEHLAPARGPSPHRSAPGPSAADD